MDVQSAAAMSRRRVSVRDLGLSDCQGWLLRRKDSRSFLGTRWKRYWFVMKKSSLYWYTDKMAEKAEGFIYLPGFTIQKAKDCKKKHAITASHPLVVTIFIAAENFADMNKWISKLSVAAKPSGLINTGECYSEGSDQDDECSSTSCPLTSVQEAAESESGEDVQPPSPSLPYSKEGGTLSRRRQGKRRVWEGRGGGSVPLRLVAEERGEEEREEEEGEEGEGGEEEGEGGRGEEGEEEGEGGGEGGRGEEGGEVVNDPPPDDMETLYRRLKAARLSPVGQWSQKDFRASFIRRCSNDKINEELHRLRILSSTLKAKQLELQTVGQILTDPTLAAPTYRKWRLSNFLLLQEIAQRSQAAGGAAEQEPEGALTT